MKAMPFLKATKPAATLVATMYETYAYAFDNVTAIWSPPRLY
jgi:hypothetical protein